MTRDPVTRYMLVQVLALFEEMLWVTEMNPPATSTELTNLAGQVSTEVQALENIEIRSCALVSSNPTSRLELVPGTIALSSGTETSAWFVPRDDALRRHLRLDKQISKRLIDVPPERQPLYQGCAKILELSADELRNLDSRIQEYILRPPLGDLRDELPRV